MKWKVVFYLMITAGLIALMWFGMRFYKQRKVNGATDNGNVQAFLKLIRFAENRSKPDADRYNRTYGNGVFTNMADHPAVTGEWLGARLPDAYCIGAGYSPGCKSTAAGAYQFIKPTWLRLKAKYNLPDFSPASQDKAAIAQIDEAGALDDVKAGRVEEAVYKLAHIWASLPGYDEGQPEVALADLLNVYVNNGGSIA